MSTVQRYKEVDRGVFKTFTPPLEQISEESGEWDDNFSY